MPLSKRSLSAAKVHAFRRWTADAPPEQINGDQRTVFYAAFEMGVESREPLIRDLLATLRERTERIREMEKRPK